MAFDLKPIRIKAWDPRQDWKHHLRKFFNIRNSKPKLKQLPKDVSAVEVTAERQQSGGCRILRFKSFVRQTQGRNNRACPGSDSIVT